MFTNNIKTNKQKRTRCIAAGKVLYRIKSCIDTFTYDFKETDPVTGKETVTQFSVKEKRVASYNPSLAAKQKAEILKQVEKVSNCLSYKKIAREELGDAVKYVSISNVDRAGKKVKPVVGIDQNTRWMKISGSRNTTF